MRFIKMLKQKSGKVVSVVLGLMVMAVGMAYGEANNLYPNGIEGIKAASVPPPGFYYKMYNVFYNADTLRDNKGDELKADFDLNLFVNAHRFLWVSEYKLLGGNFGADIIIPVMNVDIKIGVFGINDNKFGLGDICIEPFILAWHGTNYDAAFAAGFFAPTGSYDQNKPASPGKDMWTGMFTLGGTYYFDDMKTWSASLLSRYEIHGEKKELNVTPGDDFHFEWGIGKAFAQIWEAGLSGYCQWQITNDDPDTKAKDKVYAIGPEVSVMIPQWKLVLTLRSLWEFGAEDRSEGNFTVLTFTKIF